MKKTYIINTLLTLGLLANAYATNYTDTLIADGIAINLEDGDSIVSNSSSAIRAQNDGSIAVSGAIHAETSATGNTPAVLAYNGGVIDLGDGSTIIGGGDRAISTNVGGSTNATIRGTNLAIETRGNAFISVFASNGLIDLGENSTILTPNAISMATSGTGHFQASKLTVVNTQGRAMDLIGSSSAYIGTGSSITVTSENAFHVLDNSNLTIEGSRVSGSNNGISVVTSGSLNLINSNVSGGAFGVCAYSMAEGLSASYTIQGGSVTSETGTAIGMEGRNSGTGTTTILINGGARISGGNGLFFESRSADTGTSSVTLEGADTIASGRFIDTGTKSTTALTVQNGAKWETSGNSNMDSLTLDGANIGFTFSSAEDSVQATALTFGANKSDINIGLSEAFAELIFLDPLGEFVFAIDDTFAGATADEFETSANVNIAGSAGQYTWLSEYLGNGEYRLYNFQQIPETSTFAAMFGAIALALAAYRRRK